MDKQELSKIAKQMVAAGKGILAADESEKTVGKRFASINLENNEPNRKAFREMLLTAAGEEEFISGVILHDETIRQSLDDGRSFVSILQSKGVLPGIKVDLGLMPMAEGSEEQLTKGLDGLADRLKEYAGLGAKFTKWGSVITIGAGMPTDANIRQNAKDLAQYALIAQQAGLVPMVEPEVLIDGDHSIEQAEAASTKILTAVFEELKTAGVALEGTILKTSMVISGKAAAKQSSAQEVADATTRVFKKCLPNELAGEAFLSGGQGDVQATENLNAINLLRNPHPSASGGHPLPEGEGDNENLLPWPLTFSYARALQDAATKVWAGKKENMEAAQKVFLHRAKMNSLASLGKYDSAMEKDFKTDENASSGQD